MTFYSGKYGPWEKELSPRDRSMIIIAALV